jgi:DNA-binding MurR/RpiR family transcriptional regulator
VKYKERLSLHYGELTPKDKTITKSLLKHPEQLTDKTVQQATEKIGVSPAAMIRYVKKLGYRGYQEFVMAVEEYYSDLTKVDTKPDADTFYHKVLNTYAETIDRAQSLDFDPDLAEVAQMIKSTQHGKVLGIGNSAVPAQQLVYSLYTQGIFLEAITTETQIFYLKEVLDESYLLIIYTVSGIDGFYKEIVDKANAAGAKTVIITMNPESESRASATKQFTLPNGEAQVSQNGSLYQVDNRLMFFILAETIAYYVKNANE